jgi:Tfp pilus assembly protein PilN
MSLVEYKKWLAIGTGVGIEIGHEDLQITVTRVRPSGVSVLGSLTIHKFREQPAAEWGDVYANFLRKLGQRHIAAQVLLPREAVVVRQVQLPGVADKDMAAALKFQIDSLHPFQEDDVIYDHARIGKTSTVLVGIGRRNVVDEYATLFSEAGIKISAFTFSAATLYAAVRMLNQPPADGFLAFGEADDELEAYGESPARPVFSARLDESLQRARVMALSELRLPPETEAQALTEVLPKPLALPDDYDIVRGVFVYATAIAGACPWLSLSTNLLPPELRKNSSRYIYVPTIVLAVLVVAMTVVLSAYSSFEDKRYLGRLQVEIQRIQPRAQLAATLDKKIAVTRNRAQALDNFRRRLKDDMNAINDLSGMLAPPAWLTSLQLTRDSLSISGEAERAEALLKLLDSSKQFRRSEFTLPIAHGANGEVFSLHSAREGITP